MSVFSISENSKNSKYDDSQIVELFVGPEVSPSLCGQKAIHSDKVSLFPAQIHPKVESGRWHWNLEQRSFNISANGEVHFLRMEKMDYCSE